MELPIYECANGENASSRQKYPVFVRDVVWVPRGCEKAPNGTLQVYFQEAGKESFSMTTLLQCYTGKKGRRYTIWGKHRIYEGYSGPVVLRNVPDGVKNIIQEDAEKYGTIIE